MRKIGTKNNDAELRLGLSSLVAACVFLLPSDTSGSRYIGPHNRYRPDILPGEPLRIPGERILRCLDHVAKEQPIRPQDPKCRTPVPSSVGS